MRIDVLEEGHVHRTCFSEFTTREQRRDLR